MKVVAIVNPRARRLRNDPALAAALGSMIQTSGIRVSVRYCTGRGVGELLRDVAEERPDAVIGAGGDGTISEVAEISLHEGIPLGVIPAGTHNHFAHDLGIPTEPEEAIGCIARGAAVCVDVGQVNERAFINNASVGAYPHAVEQRGALVRRWGLRKSLAQIIATLRVFSQRPEVQAELEIDGVTETCRSPFLFVGNNEYRVRPLSQPLRRTLNGGRLCVFTTEENGLGGFFRLLWLALNHRLEQAREFHSRSGKSVQVRLARQMVRVSKDGEVLRLKPPLHFAIRPKALQVFAPEPCA